MIILETIGVVGLLVLFFEVFLGQLIRQFANDLYGYMKSKFGDDRKGGGVVIEY